MRGDEKHARPRSIGARVALILALLVPFSVPAEHWTYDFFRPYYSYPWYYRPRSFDDRVFDVGKDHPASSPSLKSEGGRPSAPAAPYSAERRNEWIAQCEYLKKRDFRAFQRCFRQQESRFLEAQSPRSAGNDKASGDRRTSLRHRDR